jgi:Fungal specific transcription factor domain
MHVVAQSKAGWPTVHKRSVRMPTPLNQSIVEVAFHYFFNAYISGSCYGYIYGMLDDFTTSRSFIYATRAVAVANLARERKDDQLMRVARCIHVKAIKEMNSALNSKEVMRNSTLVATFVLGIFEATVMGLEDSQISARDCLKNWIFHTNGTLSLVMFRGKELLDTPFGKKIYFLMANKVRANCILERIRLPPNFQALDKKMAPLMPKNDMAVQFWPVLDTIIELHVMEQRKQLDKYVRLY